MYHYFCPALSDHVCASRVLRLDHPFPPRRCQMFFIASSSGLERISVSTSLSRFNPDLSQPGFILFFLGPEIALFSSSLTYRPFLSQWPPFWFPTKLAGPARCSMSSHPPFPSASYRLFFQPSFSVRAYNHQIVSSPPTDGRFTPQTFEYRQGTWFSASIFPNFPWRRH